MERARSYGLAAEEVDGMDAEEVDGMDAEAVYAAARAATDRARSGEGRSFPSWRSTGCGSRKRLGRTSSTWA